MRSKILLPISISILFSLLFNNFSYSQSSDYRFQLFFFTNESTLLRSLTFGGHTDASYCIDQNLGEEEQPPSPPAPSFDVRFIDPRTFNVNCMGLGLNVDIRKWSNISTIDTFKIKIQYVGNELPLTLRWNNNFSNYLISARLTNRLNNPTINVDMLDQTEYVLDDPDILTYFIVVEKKPVWVNTPPPTPIQLYPYNRMSVYEDSVLLVWTPVGSADRYSVQIAKDFLFNNLVFSDSALTDTTLLFRRLELNVLYYWKVQAINSNGYSCYTIHTFKYIIPRLHSPNLISPYPYATGISRTPILTWQRVLGATSYELQVATDDSCKNLVFHDSTITATQQQIGPLEIDRVYYWRVRARNMLEISSYSSISNFKVSLPKAPRLLSPLDKELGVSFRPNFMWDGETGIIYYRLQIAKDSLFEEILFDDSTLTRSSSQGGPLTNNNKYYWRVRALNACGWGKYSQVREFTVSIPSVPNLKLPPNGAIDISIKPQYNLYSQYGANSYYIQISRDSLFNQIVDEDTLKWYRNNFKPLLVNTTYYWRGRAINDNGASEFSRASQFTTGTDSIDLRISIPLFFNTSSTKKDTLKFGLHKFATYCIDQNIGEYELPTVGSGYDVRFIDSKTDSSSCLGYGLKFNYTPWNWYDRDRIDSFKISIQANHADYPIEISWPDYLSTYYNFIEIWDVGGNQIVDMLSSDRIVISSHLSNKLMIYTMKIVEGTWTGISWLGSPVDGAEINTLTPTLTWTYWGDVNSYRIQLATNPMFYNPIIDDFWIAQTSKIVGPLVPATRYYWRVKARGTAGETFWSPILRFTTPSIVSVRDKDIVPDEYRLYQNYPNPFNPNTNIEFQLKDMAYVTIQVFNTLGQQVALLTNREIYDKGRHEIIFEAGNLPSGVYFYRMVIENLDDNLKQQTFMKKMLLLK